jgi:hypothetical protein
MAMNQTVATVIGLLALLLVLAIPVVILRLVGRAHERGLAAIAGWAIGKGFERTEQSASRGVHPAVQTVSFAHGRDLVSFAIQASSSFVHFTIYMRPHEARLPALGLQRRTLGGGGSPLGDPGLDQHFRLLHGGAPAVALLRAPEVYATLLRDHAQVFTLHVHDGVLILDYQLRNRIEPDTWDRAWELAARLLAA